MPSITLYIQPGFEVEGRPRCFSGTPFAIKVQRILVWKRLPFRVREVGWLERASTLPTLGSSKKLPVLDYDGELIEDSTAVAHFLEERHPTPPLIPADPLLAARCQLLEDWADEVLYWYGVYSQRRISARGLEADAYFRDLPQEYRALGAERLAQTVEKNMYRHGIGRYAKEKVIADIRRGLDALTIFVASDGFVAGPAPSLADFALFGQFQRRLAGTDPWLEREVALRPALVDWLARVDELTKPAQASPV